MDPGVQELVCQGNVQRHRHLEIRSDLGKDPCVAHEFLRNLMHFEKNMAFDCLLKFALAESTRKKDIDYLLYQQLLSRVLNHHESVPGFLDHVVKTLKSHEDVLFIAQKVMSDYLFQLDTATASSTTGGSANKNKKLQLVREATSVTLIVKNAYYILSRISPPSKDIELSNLFHSDIFADSKEASLFQFASRRKAFSQVWLGFLRHPLDGTTYKDILSSMHVNLLPHLVEPRLLIDFLVQAYDQGGVVALLALNGLFTLITKHNL